MDDGLMRGSNSPPPDNGISDFVLATWTRPLFARHTANRLYRPASVLFLSTTAGRVCGNSEMIGST
jgi:hypothetical protein